MTTNKKPPTTRLPHPRCDRKRCMEVAQMFPIIIIPSPKWSNNSKAKIKMEMDLNLCPRHAVEDISIFLPDQQWAELVHNFGVRKMALPERDSIYVIFRALEDRQVAK